VIAEKTAKKISGGYCLCRTCTLLYSASRPTSHLRCCHKKVRGRKLNTTSTNCEILSHKNRKEIRLLCVQCPNNVQQTPKTDYAQLS